MKSPTLSATEFHAADAQTPSLLLNSMALKRFCFQAAVPVGLVFSASLLAATSDNSHMVVEAFFTTEEITLDGELSEAAWQRATPANNFIQGQPNTGEAATELTEIRILFDKENLYFGATCFESEMDKRTVISLQRDFSTGQSDIVGIIIDTFNDQRNSYAFATNPRGAKVDVQFHHDGQSINFDWDAIFFVKTKLYPDRWTAEFAVPFKSLRFANTDQQIWGINFIRRVRRKGENSFWAPLPYRINLGRVSYAGKLIGLQGVSPGRNLKVTPYVTTNIKSSASKDVPQDNFDLDAGVDVKYGLTSQLALDATYNTDFSNVEVDSQQVNLTRFNLFFPEKRDFFLENSGFFIFDQSEALPFSDRGFRTAGSRGRGRRSPRTDFIPFFTRRVGLSDAGTPIPILAGARLSGEQGPHEIGLLYIKEQGGNSRGDGFTVARVARRLSKNARVGGIFVDRSPAENRVFGVDNNLRFFGNLIIDSFWAKTVSKEEGDDNTAWKTGISWRDTFWNLNQSFLDIGSDVRVDAGFVPRRGIRKSITQFGIHPRPKGTQGLVREFFPHGQIEYITDQRNQLLTRVVHAGFATTLVDGAFFEVARTKNFERLEEAFNIQNQASISPGDYNFDDWTFIFSSDPSRKISGSLRYDRGDFFDGRKTTYTSKATFRHRPHFFTTLDYQRNEVELPEGAFDIDLFQLRFHYGFNPAMFVDAFIQYNSSARAVSSNIRFNLIHRPLSNLYLVYNENRDNRGGEILDRVLAIKFTYLAEF